MEKSTSNDQPRCPCGFWGSSSTLGLCSQCYKSHIEKTNDALQSTPDGIINPETARQMKQNGHSHIEGTKQNSHNINLDGGHGSTKPSSHNMNLEGASSSHINPPALPSSSQDIHTTSSEKDSSDTKSTSEQTVNNSEQSDSAVPSSSASKTPEKRGLKRDITQVEGELTPESSPEKAQKNKKRCYQCKCKLELAQRQIGRCKCDYVFCSLHRLPELHNCIFDHKEDGRREAREKMVKPTRHLGTSFQRLDPDS